eukprot:UN03399
MDSERHCTCVIRSFT